MSAKSVERSLRRARAGRARFEKERLELRHPATVKGMDVPIGTSIDRRDIERLFGNVVYVRTDPQSPLLG